MRTEFTGTFDSLSEDYLTNKQKAALTLNEDAREVFASLVGCKVSIIIKKYREKRSLDANAYFHVLVGKIADVLNISKARCKNILICRYGQVEYVDDQPAVLKTNIPVDHMLEQEFLHCTPVGVRVEDGTEVIFYKVYRGSHTYDTKEMSILIDGTVSEAKELDIETMTPDELERMMKAYEKRFAKREGMLSV